MAKYSYSISTPLQSKRVDNNFLFQSDDDDNLSVSDFSCSNQDTSSALTTSRNITSKYDTGRTSDSPVSDMSQHREGSG